MKKYRSYEREMKKVFRKEKPLAKEEQFTMQVIDKAKEYFEIYDATENKNYSAIFTAAFLTPKNDGRRIIALSDDFGLCARSFLRNKKKVLNVYAYIYDKFSKVT